MFRILNMNIIDQQSWDIYFSPKKPLDSNYSRVVLWNLYACQISPYSRGSWSGGPWHLVCTLEVFHVHSYQDQFIHECVFCVFSLGLYSVYSFVFLWFVCVPPSFYVSLGSWIVSRTVFDVSVTNLNEPPRALATSTIAWVRSQLHPFWAVVNKSNGGLGGYYVAGPPLLNERCTSLLRAPRLRNDLYCVEWDVKLYYTIPIARLCWKCR